MTTARTCLVTGATGVIGVPLVDELLRKGHRVRVIVRDDRAPGGLHEDVEVFRGDLRDADVVRAASAGVDWIFHLAAKLHVNDPGADARDEYLSVNVEGTRLLLAAALEQGVEKFVFFSTINVYGPGAPGKVFDETSDPAPVGIYAESKLAAEKLVTSARDPEGRNVGVVLRLAAVYGSRMKGNYVRLADAIRRGRFLLIGSGSNRRTVVHYSDVVRATILAAGKAPGGSVYNVTDGTVHTLNQIVEAISTALGKSPPRFHVPVIPVTFGLAAIEGLARLVMTEPPVTRQLLEKFLEDIAVDGGKIQRELGFHPEVDLDRGWPEATRGTGQQAGL